MTYMTHASALPDPHDAPRFYEGVVAKRALAWVIDVTAITLLTILAGLATLTALLWVWPITFLAIGALYRIATLNGRSATPGMRLMGIELRGHDGERFDGMQALLHVMGYYASMTFVLPMLASVAAMFVTERRQGLTDLVMGSAAINSPG